MNCAQCGSEQASGRFCSSCGAVLGGASCRKCGSQLEAGARFCTQCGESVQPRSSMLPWYITGAGLVILIVVLLVPVFRGAPPASGAGPEGPFTSGPMQGGDGAGSPPPLSGNMRENADRLFNRIMQSRESGDSTQAQQFLPMAISAYQQAGDLDADGLYHLSLLQSFAGDAEGAMATARQILAADPSHLLGLSAAAEAARLAGNNAEVRSYSQKIVAVYSTESKRDLVEYRDHGPVLPSIEALARERLK